VEGSDAISGDRLTEGGRQESADARGATDEEVLDDLDPDEDRDDGDDLVANDRS
jgi:hypothetical protein